MNKNGLNIEQIEEAKQTLEKLKNCKEPLFISFQTRSGRNARCTVWGNPGFICKDYLVGNLGSGWQNALIETLKARAGSNEHIFINWGACLYF